MDTKQKTEKLDFIQIKNSYSLKISIKKIRPTLYNEENICKTFISYRTCIQNIKFSQLNIKTMKQFNKKNR